MNKKLRLYGYARCSGRDQAIKGLSIPCQVDDLHRWVEQQGHEIVEMFVDEGRSAWKEDATKRAQFMRMENSARDSDTRIDGIVVVRYDRFSRQLRDGLDHLEVMESSGLCIISIREYIEPGTPVGNLIRNFLFSQNQYYSDNLSTMISGGKETATRKKYFDGGQILYGYRTKRTEDDRHSVMVLGPPQEVDAIKTIFHLASEEGLGIMKIARRLDDLEIPPAFVPSSKTRTESIPGWRSSRVYMILKNSKYAGRGVFGQRAHSKLKKKKVLEEGPEIVEGFCPPIVSLEQWERVQAMMMHRRYNDPDSKARSVTSLLGKMLFCECGATFRAQRYSFTRSRPPEAVENYRYYRCARRAKRPKECRVQALRMNAANEAVIQALRTELSPARITELERKVELQLQGQREDLISPVKLEKHLKALDLKIQRFYDAIGAGMSPSECKARIEALQEEKVNLKRSAQEARDCATTVQASVEQLESARLWIREMEAFEGLPFIKQRALLLDLIERIDVASDGTLNIHLRLERRASEAPPQERAGKNSLRGRAVPHFISRSARSSSWEGSITRWCWWTTARSGAGAATNRDSSA